jgi:hypothetical protein
MYPPEIQEAVLDVVETGVGANGEYVLFNAKRAKKDSATKQEATNDYQTIVESLGGLGLSVTKKQIGEAVNELGISATDSPDSIKAIFLHLKS